MQLRLATRLAYESAAGVSGALAARDAALLAWLAIEGPTSRARLARLLWPEHDDDAARNSLRQRLFQLRRQVGADLISGSATLTLADGVAHDLADTHSLLGTQVLAIGAEFDAWLLGQRERRRGQLRQSRVQQLQQAEKHGNHRAALASALDWLADEPHLEEAHRAVMRLHYLLGDRAAALSAFARCEQALAADHGARPDAQTLALRATVLRADGPPATRSLALPAGVLRPPRLVGRQSELAAIEMGWVAGRVVALVGDAGMGKSRLMCQVMPAADTAVGAREAAPADASEDAAPRGIGVCARPGDAGVPLATLARLLRAITLSAPPALAPAARRELARALPEWADGAPPAEGQRLLLHRAVRLLLTQQRRLDVIAVDDLHFADAASLELMAALLNDSDGEGTPGTGASPLRWLLAYRPAEAGSALTALQEALEQQARLQRVPLLPLDEPALAELVDSLALPGFDGRALAGALRKRTGGNPLFVLETLKQAWVEQQLAPPAGVGVDSGAGADGAAGADRLAGADRGAGVNGAAGADSAAGADRGSGANSRGGADRGAVAGRVGDRASPKPGGAALQLPRPPSVMRLIEQRIAQLSPLALSLARCAALAGQDFSAGLAARVLGMPALALADAWGELEAAQVLRDQAFVHDLYFEAAQASVPRSIARHLHGEIALALQADPQTAPATLAGHWLAAGQPSRAAPELARAAQAAGVRLAPADAAAHWQRLAQLQSEAGDAVAAFDAARQAVLALRSTTSGPALEAAVDALDVLARSGEQRALAGELRAGMLHARGDARAAADALAQALQTLGPDAPVASRVGLLNMRGVLLRHHGATEAARQALEQALVLARQPDAQGADLPAVLNNLGLVLQDLDEHVPAVGLLQQAAELQPDALVRARVQNNLAISLEAQGLAALALEQRLAAARWATGAGDVVELNLAISLGANAQSLGRYRDALAHLARARSLLDAQAHFREEDLQRHLAALWLDLGRINLAREALDVALRLSTGRYEGALVAGVQARLVLQQGGGSEAAKAQALALLRPALQTLDSAGQRRGVRRLTILQARCLPGGDALALMQRMAALPGVQDSAAAGLPVQVRLAQALLALGQPGPALRHAQRAADWLAAVWPADMKPSEVLLTLAQCALASGDTALAAQAAAQGRSWVLGVADSQLDEVYREGWLLRNPDNAGVVALAARLTPG